MNYNPDPSLDISWYLILNDGTIIYDKTPAPGGVSEWRNAQGYVNSEIFPIGIGLLNLKTDKRLEIGNGYHYFFFSKRAGYVLGHSQIPEQYGIGFVKVEEDGRSYTTISWHDSELNLIETEERDIEKCREIMIPKIMTASSSQS